MKVLRGGRSRRRRLRRRRRQRRRRRRRRRRRCRRPRRRRRRRRHLRRPPCRRCPSRRSSPVLLGQRPRRRHAHLRAFGGPLRLGGARRRLVRDRHPGDRDDLCHDDLGVRGHRAPTLEAARPPGLLCVGLALHRHRRLYHGRGLRQGGARARGRRVPARGQLVRRPLRTAAAGAVPVGVHRGRTQLRRSELPGGGGGRVLPAAVCGNACEPRTEHLAFGGLALGFVLLPMLLSVVPVTRLMRSGLRDMGAWNQDRFFYWLLTSLSLTNLEFLKLVPWVDDKYDGFPALGCSSRPSSPRWSRTSRRSCFSLSTSSRSSLSSASRRSPTRCPSSHWSSPSARFGGGASANRPAHVR